MNENKLLIWKDETLSFCEAISEILYTISESNESGPDERVTK